MARKNWHNIAEILSVLNDNCNYLILRNFENLSDESYYMDGHDDIDFLCDNQKKIKRLLDARRSIYIMPEDHFYIKIQGKNVKIGIKYVGDQYYDISWEKEILKTKQYHENGFYVMNEENYFYTLLYHALIQKKVFLEDYKDRLSKMAKQFGIIANTEEEWLFVLKEYLMKKKLKITYPKEYICPLRIDLIKQLPAELYDDSIYKRKSLREWFYWKRIFMKKISIKIIALIKRGNKKWEKR